MSTSSRFSIRYVAELQVTRTCGIRLDATTLNDTPATEGSRTARKRLAPGALSKSMTLARADFWRQMRHARRDRDHVARARDNVLFQPVAEPHLGLAFQQVDRGFVGFMQMRLGAPAGGNGQQMHANPGGTGILCRNPREIGKALFAV